MVWHAAQGVGAKGVGLENVAFTTSSVLVQQSSRVPADWCVTGVQSCMSSLCKAGPESPALRLPWVCVAGGGGVTARPSGVSIREASAGRLSAVLSLARVRAQADRGCLRGVGHDVPPAAASRPVGILHGPH